MAACSWRSGSRRSRRDESRGGFAVLELWSWLFILSQSRSNFVEASEVSPLVITRRDDGHGSFCMLECGPQALVLALQPMNLNQALGFGFDGHRGFSYRLRDDGTSSNAIFAQPLNHAVSALRVKVHVFNHAQIDFLRVGRRIFVRMAIADDLKAMH